MVCAVFLWAAISRSLNHQYSFPEPPCRSLPVKPTDGVYLNYRHFACIFAAAQEGDLIEIDSPAKKLNLLISEEELKGRLARWKPVKKELKGYLKRYTGLVRSAHTGATFE